MNVWWLAIRPKTLFASIGPVLLATALASKYTTIDLILFAVTLLCALFLQISVNLANDLFDGLSGVDNKDRVGPQRAFQSGLISGKQLKFALALNVLAAVVAGCYLIYQGGPVFLLLGIFSVLGVFCYSAGPFPLASNALGEVTVFVFFGLIAVVGSFYLQVTKLNPAIFLYASCIGLLNSALMLVNNIRDISSDSAANKHTLAVKLGDKKARKLYIGIVLSSLAIHVLTSYKDPEIALIPTLICLLFVPKLWRAVYQFKGAQLNQLLANTAVFGFIYSLTTALVLILF